MDDPDVPNTGVGSITHADLGAREFTGAAPAALAVASALGKTPQDYLTVAMTP